MNNNLTSFCKKLKSEFYFKSEKKAILRRLCFNPQKNLIMSLNKCLFRSINNNFKNSKSVRKTRDICCYNTDSSVQVYKSPILDYICKTNQIRSWLSFYNQFHLNKFEKPNPAINQNLKVWFKNPNFHNELEKLSY